MFRYFPLNQIMFVHMMRSCSHSVNSEPPSYSSFFVGVYVCRVFCCLELCSHERYRLFVFPLGLQCLFRAGCQDMVSMFVSNKLCFRGVYVFHSGTPKNPFCAVFSHMIAPQGRQTHAYCLSELLLSENGCSFN